MGKDKKICLLCTVVFEACVFLKHDGESNYEVWVWDRGWVIHDLT